jgi:phospholipid transport system substrate-binding protein
MGKPVKVDVFLVDSWKAHHFYRGVRMKMPVRQRSTSGRFGKREGAQATAERGPAGPGPSPGPCRAGLQQSGCRKKHQRNTLWAWGILGPVLLVLLAWGQGVSAEEKAPQGAKERAGSPSAPPAQDANDPNESWWRKWDLPVKDPNNPNELMAAKWNAVLTVLQSKDLEQKTKEKIMDKLISPVFDFPLMGQLALGRTHWPKLNPAQREKFTRLFVERLKALYLEKTILYTDEKITLKPGEPKKNTVQIPMVLISGDKEVAILYKLHRLNVQGQARVNLPWRIYDVEIEGVSILLTYRSQFDDILRRGTVEDLLSHLEKSPSQ